MNSLFPNRPIVLVVPFPLDIRRTSQPVVSRPGLLSCFTSRSRLRTGLERAEPPAPSA
jgi:hypothetical protein